MIELAIPTLDEFLRVDTNSEYFTTLKFAIKYADIFRASKDNYTIGDLTEKEFGLIKDYQYDREQEMQFNEQIEYLLKFSGKDNISNDSLCVIVQSINYINNEIITLTEAEKQQLTGSPLADEMQAAGDKFDGIGGYMQLRQLAGNDILKIKEVRKVPYNLAFLELYTSKQVSDFEKDLHTIRNRK